MTKYRWTQPIIRQLDLKIKVSLKHALRKLPAIALLENPFSQIHYHQKSTVFDRLSVQKLVHKEPYRGKYRTYFTCAPFFQSKRPLLLLRIAAKSASNMESAWKSMSAFEVYTGSGCVEVISVDGHWFSSESLIASCSGT